MDSFWGGALSPEFQKSIGTVKFIPLADMTDEDWALLDYPLIRDKAKNRIADLIVTGDLVGFFQINILEKAKAKNRYYWPATRGMKEKYQKEDSTEAAPFFRHEREALDINDNTDVVESLMVRMANPVLFPNRWVVRILAGAIAEAERQEQRREEARETLLEDHPYAEALLEELEDATEDGAITSKEIPWYRLLLVITFCCAVYGIDRVLEILDEVELEEENGRS